MEEVTDEMMKKVKQYQNQRLNLFPEKKSPLEKEASEFENLKTLDEVKPTPPTKEKQTSETKVLASTTSPGKKASEPEKEEGGKKVVTPLEFKAPSTPLK